MYPIKFEDLIIALHRLPGVGMKTAERYAYALLDWDPSQIKELQNAIKGLTELKRCKVCGNLSEGEICDICSNENRDHSTICVVQTPKNLMTIEDLNEYEGVYHVLNGAINTQKGILPDQLNIDSLEKRIHSDVKEVILALDPTVEGETTSLYLTKLLEGDVNVTRLAYGIPVGGHLDYTDQKTLSRAFEGRIKSK